ncbi:RAVE protein 1 C terminal-domain-containing protein [Russula earlei]|uniref:RAVE protein 1 C terminal-domain-containing protein n=1 Tax=Russula earlei TaxID=71964 RepID=A0ACC0UPA1_9AGAM|nr:RAVE protein 1 C terminal-domain-containing protein [Russula earlei]
MLNLVRTFPGSPCSAFSTLSLPTESLLLYPSADTIVVLDATSLRLVRTLAFSQVFPGRDHTRARITSLAVDPALKLVATSSGPRLAVWSLSGVSVRTWLVHSSLVLPDDKYITALDCSSGLLAVATPSTLSVYTLIMENDLPTWSCKWIRSSQTTSSVYFSPSLVYLAATSEQAKVVGIILTASGRQVQAISHPRPVTNVMWRSAQASSRDSPVLFTVTRDATLRIFIPVLDSPQYMQLHATLDLSISAPPYTPSRKPDNHSSNVFYLDREMFKGVLAAVLKDASDINDTKLRRLQDICDDEWDMFLQVLPDGSLTVRAIANIDRRPPTLLKQLTLLQNIAVSLPHAPSYLRVVRGPTKHTLALVSAPPLSVHVLEPLNFFDSRSGGLTLRGRVHDLDEDSHIKQFVRTPDGSGLAIVRETGGEAWMVRDFGTVLQRTGRWTEADFVVVLNEGRSFATFSTSTCNLTLHTTPELVLPLPSIVSLFSLPPRGAAPYECIYAVTADATPSICHVHALSGETPSLCLVSQIPLPLLSPTAFVLPVDPMGWLSSRGMESIERDVLLSIGRDGELMFWVPEGRRTGWRCTGRVRTGRTRIRMARCSSAKKTVLIVPCVDGEELTIWDSMESEFSSGLEYAKSLSLSDQVHDLDWSSTPDGQSILAVGFTYHVEVLCEQRMTYFDDGPGWGVIRRIEIENLLSHPISDSIWLAYGTLLVGSGHQMCLYGVSRQLESEDAEEGLFEYVARLNGPLADYHPQMLLQCLLWDKLDVVKEILVNLSRDVERWHELHYDVFESSAIPIDHYFEKRRISGMVTSPHRRKYSSLLMGTDDTDELDDQGFSRSLIERLLSYLEATPLPYLKPNEHAHLLVLIQAMLEVDDSRRALDANGFRYLISMRSFYILNKRASAPSSPESRGALSRRTGRRARLRYRDIIWAFHSESQGLLLSASLAACQGKMTWSDARALGVFLWLNSTESMRSHMELIARTEYMNGDSRDPVACSLFYFALGKHRLVQGLWRQAVWHKEQAVMLQFLSNDFTQPRWRTAALKNAYALLGKRRFEYAAAFFLLGGSLKDAVNVCLRHLDDVQLAVALARVTERQDDGPVLRNILYEIVIPLAFKKGNRWLGSWAFWLLHRRDLAVRILVTPLQDVASALDIPITEFGNPHYDDPSLALLFSQLKSKTLQTAKGTSEISGRLEFNFVLQIARVFTRMGCHALALDLVRSWSFDRPSVDTYDSTPHLAPPSPTTVRMFALEPALRRRASIIIDMDLSMEPPTRRPSPEPQESGELLTPCVEETINEEGDLFARKAGLGSLLKTAKQDVQVPEFDMDSFFRSRQD